jgi:hypothetical protein
MPTYPGALDPSIEQDRLARLTDISLYWEGADPRGRVVGLAGIVGFVMNDMEAGRHSRQAPVRAERDRDLLLSPQPSRPGSYRS